MTWHTFEIPESAIRLFESEVPATWQAFYNEMLNVNAIY